MPLLDGEGESEMLAKLLDPEAISDETSFVAALKTFIDSVLTSSPFSVPFHFATFLTLFNQVLASEKKQKKKEIKLQTVEDKVH